MKTNQYRYCTTYRRQCKHAKNGKCSNKRHDACVEDNRFVKSLLRWSR